MAYNSRISHRMSLIAFIIANSSLFAATAGFDVLVTDADSGIPIEGVEVVGWFGNDNGWRAWTESAPTYSDRKTTDKEGRCHVQGETNIGKTGVNIRKPPKDYYPTTGIRYQFTQKPVFPLMHWRPTDLVITASLQRVMHPQPLFVKRMGWRKNHDGRGQNARARLDPRAQTRPEFSAPAYDFWYNIHNRTGETKTNSKKEKEQMKTVTSGAAVSAVGKKEGIMHTTRKIVCMLASGALLLPAHRTISSTTRQSCESC